ncbi:MAG: EAL domain-containing protein [Thermoanaerobacteraceae bacterium]|nr:EAL domain-containing protein [Thermoanaerobacteraceae bacterium]
MHVPERNYGTGMNFKPRKLAMRITMIYLVIGSLWIIFSDRILLNMVADTYMLATLETIKGWFYVLISGFMIYGLVRRDEMIYEDAVEEIFKNYQELEATYEELAATEEELEQQYDTLEKSEETLREIEERYRLAVDGANDCIWDWDIKNGSIYLFSRTKRLLGYEEEELEDRFDVWKSLLHPDDVDRVMGEIDRHLKGLTLYYETEYRLRAKDGTYKWILSRGKAILDENGIPVRMAGSHLDITDRKESEDKIFELTYFDSLTGLPNRIMFDEILKEAIKLAKLRNQKLAILYLDLDEFKNVNDSMGHDVGDELLREVGSTLNNLLTNVGTAAHLGGDEFGIILNQLDNLEDISNKIEQILKAFHKPWIIRGAEFYITVSVGATIYPNDGEDIFTLLKNAVLAVYSAKVNGKDCYQFFSPGMRENINKKMDMALRLRHAVENNQFCLYYQPQINLVNGQLIGLEALIRWIDPDQGIISPKDFIPFAEETGLIVPIGEWVLREACRQNVEWLDKGYRPISISVNISARQFQQRDLVEMIESITKETGIDRRYLVLEITESTALRDLDYAIDVIKELKDMGIRVALDDFGTGYSSLNYLKLLPVNFVKIDQTFMRDIISNNTDREIAKTIICLSHKLKLRVTAEGIETEDQLLFLKNHHCDHGQGYFFSKPLPPAEIEDIISKGIFSMPY